MRQRRSFVVVFLSLGACFTAGDSSSGCWAQIQPLQVVLSRVSLCSASCPPHLLPVAQTNTQGFVYLTNVRSSSPTAGFHYNTANLGVNEEPVCCVLDERLNIINNEAACYNIRRSPLQRSFFPTAMQEWRRNETLKQQSAAAAAAAAGGTDTSSSSNIAAAAATAAAAAAANTKAHPDGYEGQLPSVEYDKVEGDDIQIGLMNKFSGDSYDSYGSYGYHTSEGPLYVGEALIFQGTSRMTIVAEKGQGRVVEVRQASVCRCLWRLQKVMHFVCAS